MCLFNSIYLVKTKQFDAKTNPTNSWMKGSSSLLFLPRPAGSAVDGRALWPVIVCTRGWCHADTSLPGILKMHPIPSLLPPPCARHQPAAPRSLMLPLEPMEKQPSVHQAAVCPNKFICRSAQASLASHKVQVTADESSDSRSVAMMIHPAKVEILWPVRRKKSQEKIKWTVYTDQQSQFVFTSVTDHQLLSRLGICNIFQSTAFTSLMWLRWTAELRSWWILRQLKSWLKGVTQRRGDNRIAKHPTRGRGGQVSANID